MEYRGRYEAFDFSQIETYPLTKRPNVLQIDDLVRPQQAAGAAEEWYDTELENVVHAIVEARKADHPVIIFAGAHPLKLGFSPLFIDLMQRDLITLLAGNGAVSIHDMELALVGGTSEDVPNALPEGKFGLAEETGKYLNAALKAAERDLIGYGEAVGRMIHTGCEAHTEFPYRQYSQLAAAYELNIPATIHAAIGTDIIDQHPDFDGCAKGGASGRDFAVFAGEITKMASGGVLVNIGSAVTGPEVLLKAVSMAANVGCPPDGIITANFDLRVGESWLQGTAHPSQKDYYFRDMKSVVSRIPDAFGGRGYVVEGNFLQTIPALYDMLTTEIDGCE